MFEYIHNNQTDDETNHNKDPVDLRKLSDQIAKGVYEAIGPFLDLLARINVRKLGVRTTLHMDNVSCMHLSILNFFSLLHLHFLFGILSIFY